MKATKGPRSLPVGSTAGPFVYNLSSPDIFVSEEPVADPLEIDRAIRDFQSGKDREGSFRVIHSTYWKAVYRFFRRRGFTHEEAEELTQDTFFRVYQSMDTYHHRGTFTAWLFTVADSVCKGEWEKRGTQKRDGTEVSYDEDPPDDPENGGSGAASVDPTQEEEIDQRRQRDELDRVIDELSPRQRQCMTLWRLGFKYKEIADVLRIESETVKQHLSAARKNLSELLREGRFLASLDQAFKALSLSERQWLNENLEQLTYKEIADLLHTEPERTRLHLVAARKRLRELLDDSN